MAAARKTPLTAAERARNYRARKAEEKKLAAQLGRDGRDGPAADPPAVQPPSSDAGSTRPKITLLTSVETSIAAMKWLRDSDQGLVDMARLYAGQIDMILEADPSATGKAASLGQLVTRILHELGGAPTVRLQHELRSMRLQAALPSEGDPDANNEQAHDDPAPREGVAPVTSIKRPPKRSRPA